MGPMTAQAPVAGPGPMTGGPMPGMPAKRPSGPLQPDTPDVAGAIEWLAKAVKRHQRHMDGAEATSEASQMKMMDEMKRALALLTGDGADAYAQTLHEQQAQMYDGR